MLLIILISLGIFLSLARAGFYYLDSSVDKSYKLLRLTHEIITHIERILNYYPVLVSQFEKEQETGDEPRYGHIWLRGAEILNLSHGYLVDNFKKFREDTIKHGAVVYHTIGLDIDLVKDTTRKIQPSNILDINNTIINIEGELEAWSSKMIKVKEIENERIFFLFK